VSTREELRKTGPVEEDAQSVIGALCDVEDLERTAASWKNADEIRAAAAVAATALDDLSKAIEAWFERNPE
jgi:cysteinyl-tRNA synthetase